MGISKKIYEKKKKLRQFWKKQLPGIQKIFKKCVYMYVCVCVFVCRGSSFRPGWSEKIYSATCIYSYPMKWKIKGGDRPPPPPAPSPSWSQGFSSVLYYRSPWDSHLWFLRVLVQIVRVPYKTQLLVYMSLVVRKPVFRVSDQVRLKLYTDCTATEDG